MIDRTVAVSRLGKNNNEKLNNTCCILLSYRIFVFDRRTTYVTERRVLSDRLIFTQFFLGVMGIRVFWKTVVPGHD